jgi:hypothetical protein
MFYVPKYVTKFIPIPGPLVGFWRGANRPYFGNRDKIKAYFPHEQKRTVLRGFPVEIGKPGKEKKPETGLFSFMFQTLWNGYFSKYLNRFPGQYYSFLVNWVPQIQ